jgi:hypothetical protein
LPFQDRPARKQCSDPTSDDVARFMSHFSSKDAFVASLQSTLDAAVAEVKAAIKEHRFVQISHEQVRDWEYLHTKPLTNSSNILMPWSSGTSYLPEYWAFLKQVCFFLLCL